MNNSDEEFVPHVDPAPPPLEVWWQEDTTPGDELENESEIGAPEMEE